MAKSLSEEKQLERIIFELVGCNIVYIYLLITMITRRHTTHVSRQKKVGLPFTIKIKLFLIS